MHPPHPQHYFVQMYNTRFFLFILCLLPALITSISSEGQPGYSVVSDRFLFRSADQGVDSSATFVSLPNWFAIPAETGQAQVGVVNRFGMAGLNEIVIGWMRPLGNGSFRLDGLTSGDVDFRQATIQAGISKRISKSFWLGSSLGFSMTSVRGYGTRWVPAVSVGVGGKLGEKIFWGSCWENPQIMLTAKGLLGSHPGRIRAGMVYHYSSAVEFYVGMGWESGMATSSYLRVGYRLSPIWKLALGYGWQPDQIILSVQRWIRNGYLQVGFSQDPVLGSSFAFSVSRHLKEKK